MTSLLNKIKTIKPIAISEISKRYIYLCFLLFPLFFVFLPQEGHAGDISCWKQWAAYIFKNGLGNIYTSGTDYLPLYHYILKFYSIFQKNLEHLHHNIFHLKLITLLFHFITGYYLIKYIDDKKWNWVLYYLLNIAILYNSLIWGQVDAILSCFIFISCYYAYNNKVISSLIFFILAINFKLQGIIFLPIIGLFLLPEIISTFTIKKVLKLIFIPLSVQVLILLPFIHSGTLHNLWGVLTGSVGKYPVVSMNAYNIWDLILTGPLITMPDSQTFMGVTYKNYGLLMFTLTSAFALLPLFKYVLSAITKKPDNVISKSDFLIICSLIPLLFFYFNTQMHERYSHPAYVFLVGYSIYAKRPFVSIIGCTAYLLNLEGVLQYMKLNNYHTLIFSRQFISVLHLITIIILYLELYIFKTKFQKVKTYEL